MQYVYVGLLEVLHYALVVRYGKNKDIKKV